MSDGRVIHRVIDGKQRLTAILDFIDGRFSLGKESEVALQGKYYSDIDQAPRNQFLSYRLPFEAFGLIDTSAETIKEIYDRFNRNVVRLNDQELRRAKFTGVFAQKMEDIANQLSDDSFWSGLKLFTRNAVRRMLDIEYVAELYVLTKDGVQEPDVLDDYYADYDDDLPDIEETQKLFDRIKKELSILDRNFKKLGADFRKTRYTNLNDFYSLWAAIRESIQAKERLNHLKTCEKLLDFSDDVASAAPSYDGKRKPSPLAQQYSDAVRQGANKKNNRELRADCLRKCFVFRK
jgi:hypothetical protein